MDFEVVVIKVGDGVLYYGIHYHINGFVLHLDLAIVGYFAYTMVVIFDPPTMFTKHYFMRYY